ncbi:MAG: hypothetical protein AABZ06_01635 [Bdellovibrionota bacterium]
MLLESFKRLIHTSTITTFIIWLCLWSTPETLAGGATRCILRALDSIINPKVESSVELELDTTSNVLKLLTTNNGKVGGLIRYTKELPPWFIKWAKENYPSVGEPSKLAWDTLSDKIKIKLLKSLSAKRKQDFFLDREILGLVVRPKVKLKFNKPTVFLGRTYKPGEHLVDISAVMERTVEYRGATEVESVSGIELHFRDSQTSGRISNDAWTLLEGLGIPRNHQHVHIVAPIPKEALKQDPTVQPALMADFFRRSNLAAEMVDIVQDDGRIMTTEIGEVTYFDSMTPVRIDEAVRYFYYVATGRNSKIGDSLKLGWVGLRGSDTYDYSDLWGIEVRSIGSTSDPKTYRNLLDALQFRMNTQSYGVSREQMLQWLERQEIQEIQEIKEFPYLLAKAWYNQEWSNLFQSAPEKIKAKLSESAKKRIIKWSEDHQELKMLVFDWLNDPIIFNNPELKAKIISEQSKAIDLLLKGNDINDLVSDFLVESGLYGQVLKSVGVDVLKK